MSKIGRRLFTLQVLVLLGSSLTGLWLLGRGTPVSAQPNPAVVGQWSAAQDWPAVSVHAALLPTGKVIFYPYTDEPRVWDPLTNAIASVAQASFNPFCSGLTLLGDGRLFVGGGHISNDVGLKSAGLYDPVANVWSRLPDMNAGRWYPTATTLADGSALIVSGNVDLAVGLNILPQVWANGSWRDLTSAQIPLPYYPMMMLAPNGKVFYAGPERFTRFLDTTGTGTWTAGPTSAGGNRSYGNGVMYRARQNTDRRRGRSAARVGGSHRPQSAEPDLAAGGIDVERPPSGERHLASRWHGARHRRQQRRGFQQFQYTCVCGRALESFDGRFYDAFERGALSRLPLDCAAPAGRARTVVRRRRRAQRRSVLAPLPVQRRAAQHHVGAAESLVRPFVFGRDTECRVHLHRLARASFNRDAFDQHESAVSSPGVFAGERRTDRHGALGGRDRTSGRLHAVPRQQHRRAIGWIHRAAWCRGAAFCSVEPGSDCGLEQSNRPCLDRQCVERAWSSDRALDRWQHVLRVRNSRSECHQLLRYRREPADAVLVPCARLQRRRGVLVGRARHCHDTTYGWTSAAPGRRLCVQRGLRRNRERRVRARQHRDRHQSELDDWEERVGARLQRQQHGRVDSRQQQLAGREHADRGGLDLQNSCDGGIP